MEVELGGKKDEVLSTLDDLDLIVDKVSKAFKAEAASQSPLHVVKKTENLGEQFPKIPRTNQCSEAVTSLLGTEWGKTPRAIGELREGMEANAIFFPKTTLSGVLVWMVKRGVLRRWKDKKRGYLYVLNEQGEP
ncbi:MAG: hypothetical protein NWE89_10050 [Candidatus Bathyarchaeota archaeon]|nr:hypothetical protein [Candidatus Bathyarchaeota archaeon]